jgi:polyvinyl alcohol dehydrogenase (cytochrome)
MTRLRRFHAHRSPIVCAFAVVAGLAASGGAGAQSWPTAGVDFRNSRYQQAERQISSKTVSNLQLKWTFQAAGDVTATPAVVNGVVYFPDTAGYLYALNASDGTLRWKNPISAYTNITGDYARATPAVTGNTLILGNQSGHLTPPSPAQVFAVNATTGAKLWNTQVDTTVYSFVTNSAVVVNGTTAIVGVTSNEEVVSAFVPPGYWAWHFRGSVLALDVATGAIKWQTYTVPLGYYGGSVWGSTASVDLKRNQVYVATGNNYMVPPAALSCLLAGGKATACIDPNNNADSIIALDLTTGAVKWVGHGMPDDAWSVACGLAIPGFVIDNSGPFAGVYGNCPDTSAGNDPRVVGPDYDFAQGPMIFSGAQDSSDVGLVGAGAKSGVFWAFKANNGALAWSTQVSPGGVTGGMQWGSATDALTIYTAASNAGPSRNGGGAGAKPWMLANGTVTKAGGWAAIDAATGKVKWTTPDPEFTPPPPGQANGARAEGAVTLANGVLFGCNMNGSMYALNAKTGAVLWHRTADTQAGIYGPIPPPCIGGPAVSNGMVFVGSGDGRGSVYATDPNTGQPDPTKPIILHPYKLYAFGL